MGTLAEFLGGTGSSSESSFEAVGTDCPSTSRVDSDDDAMDESDKLLLVGRRDRSIQPTAVFSAIFAACDTQLVRVNGWICYFGCTPPGRRGIGV
jgi:hypothetical protein